MSYEGIVANWDKPQAVDWNLVRDTLVGYLREVIVTFSHQNPEAVVYGIVLVCGQNWELSVYLNTEQGYRSMPERFRTQCIGWPPKTNEELLADLGRWYFDAWEFGLYEFKCHREVNALNNVHYELFNRLNDAESAQSGDANLSRGFLHACAGAAAILERSRELQALRRTDDFEIRLFDANTYEWDTAALMQHARQQVEGAFAPS